MLLNYCWSHKAAPIRKQWVFYPFCNQEPLNHKTSLFSRHEITSRFQRSINSEFRGVLISRKIKNFKCSSLRIGRERAARLFDQLFPKLYLANNFEMSLATDIKSQLMMSF